MKKFTSLFLQNNLKSLIVFILLAIPFVAAKASPANSNTAVEKQAKEFINDQPVMFLENLGQITDMQKKPVPFVLFKAAFPGMNIYITEFGLTYMFVKTEEKFEEAPGVDTTPVNQEKIETEVAWINLHLDGAVIKKENIIKTGPSPCRVNYFFPHCRQGIYGVRQFEKVIIKDIYPGIDWVLYGTEKTGMKYDFIVHAGSNASRLKLIYESEEPLLLNHEGDVEIKSPLGKLIEKAPYSFIQNSDKEIPSRYAVKQMDANNVEISFVLPDYGLNTLVIDPQLWWGTLYGGATDELDGPGSIDVDDDGNLVVTGYTTSPDFPVLNAGTYYDSVLIGGVYDLYIMKFTNAGVLLWSTYYGGSGNERSTYEVPFITTDYSGNIFIVGQTFSSDLPLQNAGTYFDSTFNGSLNFISDAFILKFDSSGNREWATYFGGDDQDRAVSATIDPSGNMIVTGFTNSSANFPFQSWGTAYFDSTFNGGTSDAFITKFNNSGNLIWSTFLGGTAEDHGLSVTSDASGNIFLTGETASVDFPLQNNGTFYDDTSGGTDAFLMKFDPAGGLLWSTYLGGSAAFSVEWGISIRADRNDNIFVMGYTSSTDFPLHNAGTYFDSLIGFSDMDLFLSKFDNSGSLLWSTYYGGAGNISTTWDFMNFDHLEVDTSNAVYISFNRGVDSLPTFDPGCGSYINTVGRIALAKFSNAGDFLWGTYLGAASNEVRAPIAVDNNNNLFVAGEFNNYSSIAGLPLLNPGGGAYYSTTLGPASASNHQAFQLKFIPDAPCAIVPNFVANDNHVCPGSCINFINSTTGATSYQWFFQGGTPDSSTATNPQNICYSVPGNYAVSLIATNAGGSDTLILNNYITVYPFPAPQAITQSGDTLFANPGAVGYQWYYGGNIIFGATNYFYLASQSGDYNVVATDANGCEVEAAIFNVLADVLSLANHQLSLLYPNPASEKIKIKIPVSMLNGVRRASMEIMVSNVMDEILLVQQVALPMAVGSDPDNDREYQTILDISALPAGFYFLNISSYEKTFRIKFIKQ